MPVTRRTRPTRGGEVDDEVGDDEVGEGEEGEEDEEAVAAPSRPRCSTVASPSPSSPSQVREAPS